MVTSTRLPRPFWIWLILVLATLLSWESSLSGFVGNRLATSFVLLVAVIKVRFVALEFMELRHAPKPVRLAIEAWLVILFCAMVTLYMAGPG